MTELATLPATDSALPPLRVDGPDRRCPQVLAPGFVEHVYEQAFEVALPRQRIWDWICDPRTFVDSQIWPFRVEFMRGGFEEGVLCNHHGPFLNCPGVITAVREPEYRDLQYLYGAHVFTLRWIRPTRLEFWLEELGPEQTRIQLRLSSHVKPWIAGWWTWSQSFFWRRFPNWLKSDLRAERHGVTRL